MQQWYQCPRCGAPVAFGCRFCTNCGTQLNWPTQQQPQPPPQYQQPQQPGQWGGYQQQSGGWGKKIGIAIGVIIAILALVVCLVPLKEVAYTATVEYQDTETYQETETYYETEPLSYEVVESGTDTDSYKERKRLVIGGTVFRDEVVEVFCPIGYVTLQNTDSVSGTFGVQFTFYALEKYQAASFGHPDFKFEDYLAAPNHPDLFPPKPYLDNLGWDKLDWSEIMRACEKYNRQENITLQPGETGTVTASVQDIDISEMVWKWEYTITEPTRTVEKQRTVTKERPETRYKNVTLLGYWLHY